jgi:tRNA modification GTPase
MSVTTVAVLTPPGVGAIAVLSLAGPDAWSVCRTLFQGDLPAEPEPGRVWIGRFGEPPGDEAVLSATAGSVEVQCHGGRRAVRWLVEQCVAQGAVEAEPLAAGSLALLPHALTGRTAAIVLDQLHGATGDASRYVDVGRHLTRPWRVVVAGPPNAGKSSLVNALAGFARAVVSPVPGTTRDAAGVAAAFDGWPVELIDTAGIRAASDALELAGISATNTAAASADLVLWVTAANEPAAEPPTELKSVVRLRNKCDLAAADGLAVSATAGMGLQRLIDEIVASLVRNDPPPGAAVELPRAADGK